MSDCFWCGTDTGGLQHCPSCAAAQQIEEDNWDEWHDRRDER